MKIRKGHVSNSSSSSFIVVLDRLPETWQEMMRMMFGFDCFHGGLDGTVEYFSKRATKEHIAMVAFLAFRDGIFKDVDDDDYYGSDKREFLDKYPGREIAFVNFSDDDGDLGTVMEHGEIFSKFPHRRFCEH